MSADASTIPSDVKALRTNQVAAGLSVTVRLAKFHILPQRWVRLSLSLLPFAIVLWFTIGLLRLPVDATPDYFLLSAFLAVVIELILLRYLFERTPEVLRILWARGLFGSGPDEDAVQSNMLSYLDEFEEALRHWLGHALGVLFAILAIGTTYSVQYALQNGLNPATWKQLSTLITTWRFLYLPIGYFFGWMVWRVLVIAYYLYRIGTHFDLKIQANHPDRCGGLKPLGDLCLIIVLLVLVPSIFYAAWLFIFAVQNKIPFAAVLGVQTITSPELYTRIYLAWLGVFRRILLVLIVVGLVVFTLPVYSIHQQMARRRREIQDELDRLSRTMDGIVVELRSQATTLSPQVGAEKLAALKFMQQVYEENRLIPTWPFVWTTLVRFIGAQAVPLLSLIGTSGPLIEIVKNLFKFTSP